MKKETKRYSLVEYCGCKSKDLKDKSEYEAMLKNINLSNKRRNIKYICGNVSYKVNPDNTITAYIHVYNRLMGPCTISEIDNFTSTLTYNDLVSRFESMLCTREEYYPDINVCYFETKNKSEKGDKRDIGIKYIPVIYSFDKKFLDIRCIKEHLKFQAETSNYEFFKELCNEFCFYNFIGEEISELRTVIDKVMSNRLSNIELYLCSRRLFNKFIKEYDSKGKVVLDNNDKSQISRRRLRDFGMFIRYYNTLRNSPLNYNGYKREETSIKKVKDK